MRLIADADFPFPIVAALKALRFPAFTLQDLDIPLRPDSAVMQGALANDGILATSDAGIPSQAYLYEFGARGLTIVLLRIKPQGREAWQRAAGLILLNWSEWEAKASERPSLITISRSNVRVRPWDTLPPSAGEPARPR